MKKILILPLSLYVETNMQKSIDAFAALCSTQFKTRWNWLNKSVNTITFYIFKFKMLRHWFTLDKIFNQYRRGDTQDTKTFKDTLAQIIPQLNAISEEQFIDAWNAMTNVTEHTRSVFKEVEVALEQDKELDIIFLSSTNPLHINKIVKQYNDDPNLMPGRFYLSYEKQASGNTLQNLLINEILRDNSEIQKEQIVLLYTPAQNPYPQLGRLSGLAWFFAPFKKRAEYQAKNYVAGLQKAAKEGGFVLQECHPKEKDDITKILQNTVWVKSEKEPEVTLEKNNTITPSLDSKKKEKRVTFADEPENPNVRNRSNPSLTGGFNKI